MIKFFIFLFGLITGSFLNCIIYRLKTGESFLKGRSFCPHCKHVLNFQDLIPVLSFLLLKGKCRYCSQKISWQYPLVELATGMLFVFLVQNQLTINNNQLTILNLLNLSYLLITSCFLIVIFVFDLKHYLIPDKVIYPAILVFGIWYLVSGIFFHSYTKYEILNTIFSAFGAAFFFLSIVLISRGQWMGAGDIKLAFLMGLFLGWPEILVALFLTFSIGAIIGIILIVLGKKTLKSEIPFGPFLVLGTFLSFFFSQKIIGFYLGLIFRF